MRILQIHNKYLEKGGEDTVVANERTLLQEFGHEVALCEFDNIELESISKLSLFRKTVFNSASYKKVLSYLDTFRPDVVHIHNVFYAASPSIFWALKKRNVPTVMTIHNYRFGCIQGLLYRDNQICRVCLDKNSAFYGLKNKCFKNSYIKSLQLTIVNKVHQWTLRYQNPVKKYIFLADFNKNILSSVLSLSNTEGVIKPNFVADYGDAPMSERADFFLFVGRLNEQKGLKILLNSFIQNKQKLVIIGTGPMEDEVREASANHPNIQYLGYADNAFIIEKLKKSQALIVPSLTYEGQPMTILEAFSTGTPVLANNIKNLDAIVKHGENGFLFEPFEFDSILSQFNNLNLREKANLYVNARREYEAKYSPESNHKQLMNIYNSIILNKNNNRNVIDNILQEDTQATC